MVGIGHVDINPTTLDEVQHFTETCGQAYA